MNITDLNIDGYHRVVKAEDAASGLKAIIAIHNINLGPAVGGTRLFPYSTEEEALNDVLRLSKGMTYKSALADTGFGGGKSVIIAKPEDKTPELFKAFGKFVDSLGGEYICAEDVNTSPADMSIVHSVTPHVLGLDGAGGDPSPLTALGVVESIWVTAEELGIKPKDLSVTIQGIGHVGQDMTRMLRKKGATVYITDLRADAVEKLAAETGAIAIMADQALTQPCDIFAPCAMGAILNDDTIPKLKCKAIVGCANNQLAEPRHGEMLKSAGIIYAPDYLVNAGGIINVSVEHRPEGYDADLAHQKVVAIGDTLKEVYAKAKEKGITPEQAADPIAEQRFLHPEAQKAQAC